MTLKIDGRAVKLKEDGEIKDRAVEVNNAIITAITNRMKQMGISRAMLQQLTGYSSATLSNNLRDQCQVSLQFAATCASALNMSFSIEP